MAYGIQGVRMVGEELSTACTGAKVHDRTEHLADDEDNTKVSHTGMSKRQAAAGNDIQSVRTEDDRRRAFNGLCKCQSPMSF